ncbi:hypothetical protein BX070DRAFT_236362 [Coemansia spiralis]|nr:hypothetical protein BX070DRAFT_236362 [Coemansia spiralis]
MRKRICGTGAIAGGATTTMGTTAKQSGSRIRIPPNTLAADYGQMATCNKRGSKARQTPTVAGERKAVAGPRKLKTAMQMQVTEQIELLYLQWKERNDMQIHREDTTAVRARHRREIMRQSRTSGRSRDNRTAAVPLIAGSRQLLPGCSDIALATVSQQHRAMAMRCSGVHPPRGG